MPGPVKKSPLGYKHAERLLDKEVAGALGINVTEGEKASVEQADKAVGGHDLAVYFSGRGYEKPDDPATIRAPWTQARTTRRCS